MVEAETTSPVYRVGLVVVLVEQLAVLVQPTRVMRVVGMQAHPTGLLVVVAVRQRLVRTLSILVTAVLVEQVFRHPLRVRQSVVQVEVVEAFIPLVAVVLQLMVERLEFVLRRLLTLMQTRAEVAVVVVETVQVRHPTVGRVL